MSIDLKTQLHDYFEFVDDEQGVVDLETVPRSDENVKLVDRRRTRTVPGWAYGLAVALSVLLLVGGAAWLTRGSDVSPPADDAPVTTAVTPTTGVTPDNIQAVTWVSFQFDPDRHPVLETIVPVNEGFLGIDGDNNLLASDDGVIWVPRPVPFAKVAGVSVERDASGGYWLISDGVETGLVMWRSDDGEVWTEVDTSAIRPPDIRGVEWTMLPGSFFGAADWQPDGVVVSNGEASLTSWRFQAGGVNWVEAFDIEISEPLGFGGVDTQWNPRTRTIEMFDGSGLVGRITLSVVTEDPLTIEAHSDDRTLVHTVMGDFGSLSLDDKLLGVLFGFEADSLYLSDSGGAFEEVTVPWGRGSDTHPQDPFEESSTNLVAVDGGFIAYHTAVNHPDTEAGDGEADFTAAFETWTSEDGRTWSRAETPTFALGQDDTAMTVVLERDGVFLVGVWGTGGQELWRSEDGFAWTPVAIDADGASVSVTDSFWLMSRDLDMPFGDGEHFTLGLWVSHDAETWRQVDLSSGVGLSAAAGGHGARAAGDIIFIVDGFVVTDPPRRSTMWVGRLDE